MLLTKRFRVLAAASALALGSLPLLVSGASATPITIPTALGAWGTITMPVDFVPSLGIFNWYGADAAGNIYYVPYSIGGGSTPRLRHANARSSHVNCRFCGIEEYSPVTTQSTFIDPTYDFSQMTGLTVEASGNVDMVTLSANLNEMVVMRVSPNGYQTVLNSTIPNLGTFGGIAVDAVGNVFVSTYDSISGNSTVYEIPSGGGPATSLAVISDWIGALAVAPDGTIYASSTFFGSATVYAITPGGAVSSVSQLAGHPEGIAADGAGNLYSALFSPNLVEAISPEGGMQYLPPSPGLSNYGYSAPLLLAYGGGTLYMWDAGHFGLSSPNSSGVYSPNILYTWSASSGVRPFLTSVGAVAAHVENRYTQSITANWTGGGPTYRCTLMTGFNAPTHFTVLTTSHSCTFYGLALGTSFGISVVSISGGVASAPQVGFAPAPRVTITCVLGSRTMHRTGLSPRCPLGWRQV